MTLPITAIVVSYNSASVLGGCIEALSQYLVPDQVLVVDNASTDASVDVARDLGAEVIVSPVNSGFGAACNRGVRAAKNDRLLFVNPDVRILSIDPAGLQDLASRRGPFGLVAPNILCAEDVTKREASVRKMLPLALAIPREALGPIVPRELSTRKRHLSFPARRCWLSGALLFSDRSEFIDVGGFDERLFLYYEDQELSMRYLRRGLPLSVTEAVSACHVAGGSSSGEGVREIPKAASALSSIELVGLTHGRWAAWCAWMTYNVLRQCAGTIVTLTARGRLAARCGRKCDELQRIQVAIKTLLTQDSPHYPLVKHVARSKRSNVRDKYDGSLKKCTPRDY